ncbi:MAG: leucine-rich repeat protein [Verrucomicrobiota bacterium]
MTFKKFSTLASAAVSIVSLSFQQASAATSGIFTYTDHGSSVTIDRCDRFFTGNVTIPPMINGKPVTAIGSQAFAYCGSSVLAVPSGVTTIGSYAFVNCTNLTSITFPETLKSIDESAFHNCIRLETVVIPKGLTSFGHAFTNCYGLKNVVFQQGVTTISDDAFSGCPRLEKIEIPESVTQIGSSAFRSCSKLKNLVLPSGVRTIGDHAFSSSGLVSLKLPPTVTVIGKGALAGCAALKSVKLPPDITEISDSLFADCPNLTVPEIPSKVARIGNDAFASSKCLTVSIPERVRVIGNKAFANCLNLDSALFTGKAPEMGTHVFYGAVPDFKIFIPEGKAGYTLPKWHGYRTSLPAAEISVRTEDEKRIGSGAVVTRFGDSIVGEASLAKRFTIFNVGSRKLTGLHAKIGGGNSSDFTVTTLTKSSLSPGKSATVEIQFLPKKPGARLSELRIMSSDSNEIPFVIKLKGTGLQLIK